MIGRDLYCNAFVKKKKKIDHTNGTSLSKDYLSDESSAGRIGWAVGPLPCSVIN